MEKLFWNRVIVPIGICMYKQRNFLRQPFFLYQYSAEAGLLSHKSAGALTTSSPTVWTLSSTYQSK